MDEQVIKVAYTHMETELHTLNPHQQVFDGENFRLYFQDTLKLLENKKINL